MLVSGKWAGDGLTGHSLQVNARLAGPVSRSGRGRASEQPRRAAMMVTTPLSAVGSDRRSWFAPQ